jgi:hypothetical protein
VCSCAVVCVDRGQHLSNSVVVTDWLTAWSAVYSSHISRATFACYNNDILSMCSLCWLLMLCMQEKLVSSGAKEAGYTMAEFHASSSGLKSLCSTITGKHCYQLLLLLLILSILLQYICYFTLPIALLPLPSVLLPPLQHLQTLLLLLLLVPPQLLVHCYCSTAVLAIAVVRYSRAVNRSAHRVRAVRYC